MDVERGGKYLDAFRASKRADIRCVDPAQLDDEWLFKRELLKYSVETGKYTQIQDDIGMRAKYAKAFRNRGIGTLWSYICHIHKAHDVYMVIMDTKDAQLIYDLDVLLGDKGLGSDSQQEQQQQEQVEGTHINHIHVAAINKRSDSDEMYEHGQGRRIR